MVVDTSACIDILLDLPAGRALRSALLDPAPALHAPGTLWAEVGRVLRAKVAEKLLTPRDADTALADLFDLGIEESPVEPLLPRAWALRQNMTIDDGIFVALAEATGKPLLTTDLRLARAARAHAEVRVLSHR